MGSPLRFAGAQGKKKKKKKTGGSGRWKKGTARGKHRRDNIVPGLPSGKEVSAPLGPGSRTFRAHRERWLRKNHCKLPLVAFSIMFYSLSSICTKQGLFSQSVAVNWKESTEAKLCIYDVDASSTFPPVRWRGGDGGRVASAPLTAISERCGRR